MTLARQVLALDKAATQALTGMWFSLLLMLGIPHLADSRLLSQRTPG